MGDLAETINCLDEIVAENEKEIGNDTDSGYAIKYLRYNKHLKKAIFELEGQIDPTHGYAE